MPTKTIRPWRRNRASLALLVPVLALAACAAGPAGAAEESSRREETFTFTAPAGERVLRICTIEGDVAARGHDGAEVRVVVRETYRGETPALVARAKEELGLLVERTAGEAEIAVGAPCDCRRDCNGKWNAGWDDERGRFAARHDFEVLVPRGVRVELRSVNDGEVTLRDHRGGFRLSNVNGPVSALDVAGAGSVSTVNGDLEVRFAENPREDMSFRNVNGRIDVTFRPGLAADLTFETLNGEVYTDLALDQSPVAQASRDPGKGKYLLRRKWSTRSAAGAPAPLLSFSTINGDIYLRGPAQ
jgi:hypothetical protein